LEELMADLAGGGSVKVPTPAGRVGAVDVDDVVQPDCDELVLVKGPGDLADLAVAASLDEALARLEPAEAAVIRGRLLAGWDWPILAARLGYADAAAARAAYELARVHLDGG
jgi:hypothetical protein